MDNTLAFVRVHNPTPTAGTVTLTPIDSDGVEYPPYTAHLGPYRTRTITSSVFDPSIAQVIYLAVDSTIESLDTRAYVFTTTGRARVDRVLALIDVGRDDIWDRYRFIATDVKPKRSHKNSVLRVLNLHDSPARVLFLARDDANQDSGSHEIRVPANSVRTIHAFDLDGLEIRSGWWTLDIRSDLPVIVQHLFVGPEGFWSAH